MFELSKEGKDFVKKEMSRYETKYSAIIPALYRAQDENGGWVSPEVIDALANQMDIPPAHIEEVADFYTMFNKQPVGKYHVQVCANISCSMAGGREIIAQLCKKLGIEQGEMSKDGRITVSAVECLGSCDTAPMMQINREIYNENLTAEKAEKIISELK